MPGSIASRSGQKESVTAVAAEVLCIIAGKDNFCRGDFCRDMETALRVITDMLGCALPFGWASPEFMRRALVAVLLVCPGCEITGNGNDVENGMKHFNSPASLLS